MIQKYTIKTIKGEEKKKDVKNETDTQTVMKVKIFLEN